MATINLTVDLNTLANSQLMLERIYALQQEAFGMYEDELVMLLEQAYKKVEKINRRAHLKVVGNV